MGSTVRALLRCNAARLNFLKQVNAMPMFSFASARIRHSPPPVQLE